MNLYSTHTHLCPVYPITVYYWDIKWGVMAIKTLKITECKKYINQEKFVLSTQIKQK